MSQKKTLLVLLLIGLVVYLNSLFNPFIWDDEQFIYKNQHIKNFEIDKIFSRSTTAGAGVDSNYFRPITSLTFAWDYQWWGLNPFGFHLTNTLLHIGVGIMIYLLFSRLNLDKKLSFGLAALFLVHPIQTEAVSYINSRGDSLYAFFVLAGLLVLSQIFLKKKIVWQIYDKRIVIDRPMLLVMTTVCYILAILSKEIAIVMLPLSFLVYWQLLSIEKQKKQDAFKLSSETSQTLKFRLKKNVTDTFFSSLFDKLRNQHSQIIVLLIILTVVATSYLLMRKTVWNFVDSFNFYRTDSQLQSLSNQTNSYSSSLAVRLLTFNRSLYRYFGLLVFPYPLHMERDAAIETSFLTHWSMLSLALTSLIICVAVWEWRLKKSWWWLFGWGWFFCLMLPVSGIVAINGLFYEHWLYLPMVGFFLAIGNLINLLLRHIPKNQQAFYRFIRYFFIGWCTALALLTIRQNYIWGDSVRFYEYTLSFSQSARLFNNLAMTYAEREQDNQALENYLKSLEYSNQYPQVYHNIGNLYLKQKNIDEAERYFLQALEINSGFYYSYQPLIQIYIYHQQNDKLKTC
ncbi:MAG: tetratricopeptide repeat protein [Patescibacteria group bacterium]